MRNVNTVRWESLNVTTQSWEINNRKSEVIASVINAGMNVTANRYTEEDGMKMREFHDNITVVFGGNISDK